MADVELRVAMIEERVTNYQELFQDVTQGLRQLETRVDARFSQVDQRLTSIEGRLDRFRDDMTVHFRWIAGVMLTGFLAIVAALVAV